MKEMPKLKFISVVDPLTINFDALVVVSSSIIDEDFPDKALVLKYQKVPHPTLIDTKNSRWMLQLDLESHFIIPSLLLETDSLSHQLEKQTEILMMFGVGLMPFKLGYNGTVLVIMLICLNLGRAQKAGSIAPVIFIPALCSDKLGQTNDKILKVSILATYQQIYRVQYCLWESIDIE